MPRPARREPPNPGREKAIDGILVQRPELTREEARKLVMKSIARGRFQRAGWKRK